MTALNSAARDPDAPGHEPARCIAQRNHFRLLWERSPTDAQRNPNLGAVILAEARKEFGEDAVKRDAYTEKSSGIDFPVMLSDGEVVSARSLSVLLANLPTAAFDFVFVRPDRADQARKWRNDNLERMLDQAPSEED